MARSLGSIILPEGTIWINQYEWQDVRKTFKRTVGGGFVGYTQRTYRGRPIVLNFDDGWLTNQQRKDILALANTIDLSTGFIWDDESFTVTFNDPPHNIKPLMNYYNPDNDRFTGEINLITI